ncbi:MAG: RusA family crossover junction endodeoxyribonuclease [Colwellia sp.]|nr:RusA family crossover junction endodeoxyribonuclease [Colwellia sp.]
MVRLNIKPLSVNEAWQGRRVKTQKYRKYERDILKLLRPMIIPDGKLELYLKWGFSSAGSDWDNPIKPFQDCLQKKYDFNDNRVIRAVTEKVKVKKGEEFIEFDIIGIPSND